jgi:hypothetical protein
MVKKGSKLEISMIPTVIHDISHANCCGNNFYQRAARLYMPDKADLASYKNITSHRNIIENPRVCGNSEYSKACE